MAALAHFHGVPKHALGAKAHGVFPHLNRAPASPWLRGMSDIVPVPVSRWSEVRRDDLPETVKVLLDSDEVGPCLVDDPAHRAIHMFNHLEYDTLTLDTEYRRDGERIVPRHYYPMTIRRSCRATPGAPMATSCSATGSTKSIRPRRSIWRHRRTLNRQIRLPNRRPR
jgi:homoserine O-succinyltransferase